MEKLKSLVGNEKFKLEDIMHTKKDYVITMSVSKSDLFHTLLASIWDNEEISAEIMSENMFYYIFDGDGIFEIEDKDIAVSKFDCLYIPSNTSYAIKGINNFKYLEIGFLKKENNMSINILDKSNVMKLKDMIEIEEGKVLSKNLAKNPNLVLTLMSFGQNDSLATHTAPGDALVTVLEGTGIITIDGKDFEVNENESIIMPANINHAVRSKTPFKMLLTLVINK